MKEKENKLVTMTRIVCSLIEESISMGAASICDGSYIRNKIKEEFKDIPDTDLNSMVGLIAMTIQKVDWNMSDLLID